VSYLTKLLAVLAAAPAIRAVSTVRRRDLLPCWAIAVVVMDIGVGRVDRVIGSRLHEDNVHDDRVMLRCGSSFLQ
jgi:hypothetical protein